MWVTYWDTKLVTPLGYLAGYLVANSGYYPATRWDDHPTSWLGVVFTRKLLIVLFGFLLFWIVGFWVMHKTMAVLTNSDRDGIAAVCHSEMDIDGAPFVPFRRVMFSLMIPQPQVAQYALSSEHCS